MSPSILAGRTVLTLNIPIIMNTPMVRSILILTHLSIIAFAHRYQFDESISNLRVASLKFQKYILQANSAEPDQTPT